MSPLSILFGLLLCGLGVGLYAMAENISPTALIPAFFGIALIGLGIAAFKEKARKHAMHAAALLGLLGTAIPAYRVGKTFVEGGDWTPATTGQVAMSVLCAAFLVLCVKSFIDARRRRKMQGGSAS